LRGLIDHDAPVSTAMLLAFSPGVTSEDSPDED
jgi:hypothetical protein